MPSEVLEYYRSHHGEFLEGLQAFLKIPSVSTEPAHNSDVRRAAEFVRDELSSMGLDDARLIEGEGHPLVTAEWLRAEGKPTLLIYGHYDVQPPEPLDEWESPPFEPTVRGGNLFARGAVDDKGQLYLILKAVEGHLKTAASLPVNVKILIEGEEETNGEMIEAYLREHGHELGADAALICDTSMFAPGWPSITVGLRGIIYTELEVQGARSDLHSGIFGGVAPNPLHAIAEILTGLQDARGKILIPNFYDDVTPPSEAEREAWARLPFDEGRFLENEIGAAELTGEEDYGVLERKWARPTLEVHGIRGGYVGEGAKTVIPARATAKISMRIVPHMDAERTWTRYRQHVESLQPRGTRVAVRKLAASPASLVDPRNPFVQAAAEALREVFGRETVFIREGGSIPVVAALQQYAGIPSVLMGFGLPDDNLHAPNEKFHLPNFFRGIEAVGRYLERLGQGV